jgi:hypothetical protein
MDASALRIAFAIVLPVASALLAAKVGMPQGTGAAAVILEYAAAVNLPRENAKMRALLAVPKDVGRVRCLLWVVHQGQMSEQLYGHAQVRQMAAMSKCGVVLASIQQIEFQPTNSPAEQLNRNAGLAGDRGLTKLLEQFARDTRHRELERVPILFWGFSAAAGFGTTFASFHPERTIGVIRYHAHRRGAAIDLDRLRTIPALVIAGAKDQTAGIEDAEGLWRSARAEHAPWTFAVEPEAQHSSPEIHERTMNELTIPWISAVLRHRLSNGFRLRPVSSDSAWLGDLVTVEVTSSKTFKGDPRRAVWLPDSVSAKGWQTVTTRRAGSPNLEP